MGKVNNLLFRSVGKLNKFKEQSNGIEGSTEESIFRVTFFSSSIVKIHIAKNTFNDHSYAVIQKPGSVNINTFENDNAIRIESEKFSLKISKDPLRFSFHTPDGNSINEDDPKLGTGWLGDTVITHKSLQKNERFIGLGEKTGSLDRAGNAYIHNNTDAFGYGNGTDPIYCTIPFYIGLHNQFAYGIFMDNPHRSYFNFGASNNRFSSFGADGGDMEYYFIHDESVSDIIESYTWLTGRMKLPPLWSLGYQQARYSYYPDSEVLQIARTFRDKKIPADTIVFDIHYMDKYKIFTWDKKRFPDPKGLLFKLSDQGFNSVLILDPGIKTEKGYAPYDDGMKEDLFVKYPDGSNYTGAVWPGWCHFPDFTNPKTREWWKKYFKDLVDAGVEGFWNDMNEIATWGQALPEIIEFDYEGNKASARKARNVYGLMMSKSTYKAALQHMKGKRPFTLTRSAYAGIQRYSAVWTGDNTANDEHLMLGTRLVNSLGISGVSFSGYDIGGFIGDATVQLYQRWISIGAFSPFFRGHSMVNSRSSEPWSYGEETEDIARNYIEFRYRLLPYIYSAFYESAQTGIPLSRTLAISYSHKDWVYEQQFENQYLFGPSLLVCPVSSKQDFVKIRLPENDWYDLYNGRIYKGDREYTVEAPRDRLPVFVKAGGIITLQNIIQHTAEKPGDPLEIHVYYGNAKSVYTYYEDDGKTHKYEEGEYYKRSLIFDPEDKSMVIEAAEGNYNSQFKKLKLVFHGFPDEIENMDVNRETYSPQSESLNLFKPVSSFDPILEAKTAEMESVKTMVMPNSRNAIEIKW